MPFSFIGKPNEDPDDEGNEKAVEDEGATADESVSKVVFCDDVSSCAPNWNDESPLPKAKLAEGLSTVIEGAPKGFTTATSSFLLSVFSFAP